MNEQYVNTKLYSRFSKYTMKSKQAKVEPKSITVTAERLSDHSHITFTISSDKTIEQLRALLNHHLPPLIPNRFDLYSYQRGALIHFRPSSFKLDYFPVIFDQTVLSLKMDDRVTNHNNTTNPEQGQNNLRRNSSKTKPLLFNNFFSSRTASTTSKISFVQSTPPSPSSSPPPITCFSVLKQIFHQSPTKSVHAINETNTVTY